MANDSREFVELYNDSNSPVTIDNWSLNIFDPVAGSYVTSYTIPGPATIPAKGYYVIGDAAVPNVNLTPAGAATEMFPDIVASGLVLRDGPDPFAGTVQDAVVYDVFRAGVTRLTLTDQNIIDQVGRGYYGVPTSANASAPQSRLSMARYKDGRDTNKNGLDFTHYPLTPGASNTSFAGFAENAVHTIPNVDSLATSSTLSTEYYSPYALPRVIEPGTVSPYNPRAIPPSPQLGKAIVAWDETGGGNSVYSKDLVNKFDLYAYFDTSPIGLSPTTLDREYETSSYGIGSIDPLFEQVDPSGNIPDVEVGPFTRNGSSGVGWVYQQFETNSSADPAGSNITKLFLVDFGDSGNSEPGSTEWTILETIDMSAMASKWYRLGIDYNPATDQVIARLDDQTFTHTLGYDLIGQFVVGYREGLTGAVSDNPALHNPPTFDLFVATPVGVAGDYNNNGVVDAADYVLWKNGGTLQNDATPGVQPGDYDVWRANFGKTPGSGTGVEAAGVPEPGSLVLVLTRSDRDWGCASPGELNPQATDAVKADQCKWRRG